MPRRNDPHWPAVVAGPAAMSAWNEGRYQRKTANQPHGTAHLNPGEDPARNIIISLDDDLWPGEEIEADGDRRAHPLAADVETWVAGEPGA